MKNDDLAIQRDTCDRPSYLPRIRAYARAHNGGLGKLCHIRHFFRFLDGTKVHTHKKILALTDAILNFCITLMIMQLLLQVLKYVLWGVYA